MSDPKPVTADYSFALVRRGSAASSRSTSARPPAPGKTYRMLNEAHDPPSARHVDVVVGFVETHGRVDTDGPAPRSRGRAANRRSTYRGVALEEMDVDAVIARRPQVAIVDELAHTNVPGARNGKRWQDVLLLARRGNQRHLSRQRAAPRIAQRRARNATLGVTFARPYLTGSSVRRTRSSTSTSPRRICDSDCARERSTPPTRFTTALRELLHRRESHDAA